MKNDLYQQWQELPPVMKIAGFIVFAYVVFKCVPFLVNLLQILVVIASIVMLAGTGLLSPFLNEETIRSIDDFWSSAKTLVAGGEEVVENDQ